MRPFMPYRIVYGSFLYRWWLIATTNGRYHVDGLGRACVLYSYAPSSGAAR